MNHALMKAVRAERLSARMIGRCMLLVDLVALCNAFQFNPVCTNARFATLNALSMPGRLNTLSQRKSDSTVEAPHR